MRNLVNTGDLFYETDKYVYNFQQYQTIRSFGKIIFRCKITLNDAKKDHTYLLDKIVAKPKIYTSWYT